jgi:hypothetical protein
MLSLTTGWCCECSRVPEGGTEGAFAQVVFRCTDTAPRLLSNIVLQCPSNEWRCIHEQNPLPPIVLSRGSIRIGVGLS